MENETPLKFRPGQWLIPRRRLDLGADAIPGKVIASDRDSVTVEFRYDGKPACERFVGSAIDQLCRVEWRRQRGRSRWRIA